VILMKMKQCFFDAEKVVRAVGRAQRKALSRAGAFIRRTARQSIRTSKKPAPPGQPPHSHNGQLKRFLWFAYDPEAETVVIGPAGFKRTTDAPHTLEFGGRTRVTYRRHGRKVRSSARIDARPYMAPAFAKERPNLPKLWAGSVREG
jgi:hypothetical protein